MLTLFLHQFIEAGECELSKLLSLLASFMCSDSLRLFDDFVIVISSGWPFAFSLSLQSFPAFALPFTVNQNSLDFFFFPNWRIKN